MPGVRTFHSRLFWKIYLSFASLFLIATIALSWVVFFRVQKTVRSTEIANLKDTIALFIPLAARACDSSAVHQDFGQAIMGNHETLFALSQVDGTLIQANGPEAEQLPNTYFKPMRTEVLSMSSPLKTNAASGPITIYDQDLERVPSQENTLATNGSISKPSARLVGAIKIEPAPDKICILWASRVSENLKAGLRELWNTTGTIALFGILAALALGWSLVRKIMLPIADMLTVAEALRRGQYDRRVKHITSDELGRLADTLNRLGAEMTLKISELQRLENVRRDFVANVSHEIKTPLTSIKGYVETLLAGAINDPQHCARFLEKIDRNAARLATLVQDILSLAKIEAAEDTFRPSPIEWNPVITSVISRYEDAINQKNLRLKIITPSTPVIVFGDKEAMIQVLDNLITNAIKYTPDGGLVTITLTQKNSWSRLDVEDTGIGIPSEHLDRIFERFYRVDKARSRDLGGTGLGLSIVKHLVSAMGGEIGVQSSLGSGSIFTVRLRCS